MTIMKNLFSSGDKRPGEKGSSPGPKKHESDEGSDLQSPRSTATGEPPEEWTRNLMKAMRDMVREEIRPLLEMQGEIEEMKRRSTRSQAGRRWRR